MTQKQKRIGTSPPPPPPRDERKELTPRKKNKKKRKTEEKEKTVTIMKSHASLKPVMPALRPLRPNESASLPLYSASLELLSPLLFRFGEILPHELSPFVRLMHAASVSADLRLLFACPVRSLPTKRFVPSVLFEYCLTQLQTDAFKKLVSRSERKKGVFSEEQIDRVVNDSEDSQSLTTAAVMLAKKLLAAINVRLVLIDGSTWDVDVDDSSATTSTSSNTTSESPLVDDDEVSDLSYAVVLKCQHRYEAVACSSDVFP